MKMRQLYYEDMANWIFKCQFTTLIDCDSITRQNSKKISYIDLQLESWRSLYVTQNNVAYIFEKSLNIFEIWIAMTHCSFKMDFSVR